jgi:hypothetical protein
MSRFRENAVNIRFLSRNTKTRATMQAHRTAATKLRVGTGIALFAKINEAGRIQIPLRSTAKGLRGTDLRRCVCPVFSWPYPDRNWPPRFPQNCRRRCMDRRRNLDPRRRSQILHQAPKCPPLSGLRCVDRRRRVLYHAVCHRIGHLGRASLFPLCPTKLDAGPILTFLPTADFYPHACNVRSSSPFRFLRFL